jgi:YfiH family protein
VVERPAWRLETVDDLTLARCGLLESVPGVAHAFSTRIADGGDDFDLGRAEDDGPPWAERRRRLSRAAGLAGPLPVPMLQVHGDRILLVGEGAPAGLARADGMLARRGDPAVAAVRTADCVPVLIAARDGGAVAAIHAGWRGTAGGVVGRALELLAGQGWRPARLVAAVGPAIGPCCYEVGQEVVREVAGACGVRPAGLSRQGPGSRPMLDLQRANRLQLEAAGVPSEAISCAPWCTCCDRHHFYSYRREGPGTGRMLACIGWGGQEGAA